MHANFWYQFLMNVMQVNLKLAKNQLPVAKYGIDASHDERVMSPRPLYYLSD